jgi:Zn-dependent peptidase ImmA (M78 family)/transcriptional regulator with XRE-family HTH domain
MDDFSVAHLLFDGARLTLAREYAGLRKVELARVIQLTPGAITQFEQGRSKPSRGTVAALSLALGFAPAFFESGRPVAMASETTTYFRRLEGATKGLRSRLLARLKLLGELLAVVEQHVTLPPVSIPDLAGRTPQEAAQLVRREWALDVGPLTSVVRVLERQGVIVTRAQLDTTKVDAFSRWLNERPVVVLASDKRDAARSRFDAAHELGHFVLHRAQPANDRVIEREADAFAAAFLMPPEAIRKELPERVNWGRYLALKRRWGTSVASLVRQARDLGAISEHAYYRANVHIHANGWDRDEPAALASTSDEPRLLKRALEKMDLELGLGTDVLAAQLHLDVDKIRGLSGELSIAA